MMDLFNVMMVMIRWDIGEQAETVGPFGALLRFVLFVIYECKASSVAIATVKCRHLPFSFGGSHQVSLRHTCSTYLAV